MKKKVSRVRSLYNRLDDVRSHHVDRELILLNRLIEAEALLSRWLEMARSYFGFDDDLTRNLEHLMKKFEKPTIPFNGDIIEWANRCLWRGYGDCLIEQTVANMAARYRESRIKDGVNRREVRLALLSSFRKAGWDEETLKMMGWA